MKNNIFKILTGVLLIACIVLTYLYVTKDVDCLCKEPECPKAKTKVITKSDELYAHRIAEYKGLKNGYKVLGVAVDNASYKKLTEDVAFEVIEYDSQTDCVDSEYAETDCLEPVKEKDYDKYVYVLLVTEMDMCGGYFEYTGHSIDKKITIEYTEHLSCGPCAPEYTLHEIGILKSEYKKQDVEINFTADEIYCDSDISYKPIMYLYPEEDINLEVTFKYPELLTTTYPKYNNSWNVKVLKDGSIYDQDNKYYYALYWESLYNHKVDFSEGFYVNKDNAIEFLEEKLTILGLNPKERNEFIMYWLPIIEENEHNLIYFETSDTLNINEPINFSIKPDSLIRIRMHIKKVASKTNIKEQHLTTPERNGFTVVEWGGVKY